MHWTGRYSWTAANINVGYTEFRRVKFADIDNDGDLDFVVTANNTNGISWYENDGNSVSPSWSASVIASQANILNPVGLEIADIDNDGDLDVITASQGDDTIAWHENDGAANPTWAAANIDTPMDPNF